MIAKRASLRRFWLPDVPQMKLQELHLRSEAALFVSLILHREIHPDTQNEDDDAALLIATMHGELEMTQFLTKRLSMKHTGDLNHQTKEGLTPLAVGVSYFWEGQRSIEFQNPYLMRAVTGTFKITRDVHR